MPNLTAAAAAKAQTIQPAAQRGTKGHVRQQTDNELNKETALQTGTRSVRVDAKSSRLLTLPEDCLVSILEECMPQTPSSSLKTLLLLSSNSLKINISHSTVQAFMILRFYRMISAQCADENFILDPFVCAFCKSESLQRSSSKKASAPLLCTDCGAIFPKGPTDLVCVRCAALAGYTTCSTHRSTDCGIICPKCLEGAKCLYCEAFRCSTPKCDTCGYRRCSMSRCTSCGKVPVCGDCERAVRDAGMNSEDMKRVEKVLADRWKTAVAETGDASVPGAVLYRANTHVWNTPAPPVSAWNTGSGSGGWSNGQNGKQ
ncbi:MAG: hypothetical protein SGCHY_003595 [Lobulomycetales sp.]